MDEADRAVEFSRLFALHQHQLRGLSRSLIPNRDDAEDVFQQANVVLWKKFDQYQPGTSFIAWSGRVVYLEAQRQRRRRARDKHQFSDAFVDAVLEQAADAEMEAIQHARERVLGGCIAALGDEARRMLQARYRDSVSVEQLCAAFNRSVDGIYKALSRIRRTLRDCVTAKAAAVLKEKD